MKTVQKSEERLSGAEYAEEERRLSQVLQVQDPRAALEVLQGDMAGNTKVLNSCHEILHEFGRAAFSKYNNFAQAASYQNELCVSGYIHGVLEGYFAASSSTIDSVLQTACADLPPGSFKRGECYHGIGHGLMYYSDNALPLSLRKCDLLTNNSDNEACYSGAYMENFTADQKVHTSNYLDPQRPLYPCTEGSKNVDACYMYVPLYYLQLHPGDYAGAMEVCSRVDFSNVHSCYFGVGFQAMRRHLHEPLYTQEVCAAAGASSESCIKGAAYYYLAYTSSTTTSEAFCAALQTKNQEACKSSVADSLKEYPDL